MKQSAIVYQPPASCKVYTPPDLASAMVDAVNGSHDSRWLEPSFGRGVFLEQLHYRKISAKQIVAVDLETSVSPNDRYATTVRGEDFLEWCQRTTLRFDRVVANPPYVSLLSLPTSARTSARALKIPASDESLAARSNLWSAFLLGSMRLLERGGSLTFVLPAAWDYADYAKPLRLKIPPLFEEWYCVRCEEPVFPGVSEGSIVLVGRGFGQANVKNQRISCLRLSDLIAQLRQLGEQSTPPRSSEVPNKVLRLPRAHETRLSDIIDIRLGGVTGDANYFLMTESRREELGLPEFALKPVLSKADHLRGAIVDLAMWSELRSTGGRVWLFSPSPGQLDHPAVRRYLRRSHKHGGCNRDAQKIRNRPLWYRVPLPGRIDGFISGMSSYGPWIALNTMRTLTANNTLYTVHFKKPATLAEKAALGLALLSSPVREQLPDACRRYAAGLGKFEPGDLQALKIPAYVATSTSLSNYRQAVMALRGGSSAAATEIADRSVRA